MTEVFTIAELCAIMRENAFEGKEAQKQHLLNFILTKIRADADSDVKGVERIVSLVCSQYSKKLCDVNNNFEYLKTRFSVWLSNEVVFKAGKDGRGRPSISFDSSQSDRTKRLKTEDIRADKSASCLLYAASMKFRDEGHEKCAKLLKKINEDTSISGEILNYLESKTGSKDGSLSQCYHQTLGRAHLLQRASVTARMCSTDSKICAHP